MLRKVRLDRGLSQLELCAATGIPRWRIAMHEQGLRELSPDDQNAIAETLGECVDLIFGHPGKLPTTDKIDGLK